MALTGIRFGIVGTTPYSQSRRVEVFEPKREKESHDEWDLRVWRLKAHTSPDGKSVVIPSHGIQQALVLGAQKGRLTPSAAKSAREGLAKRLETGLMMMGDASTDMSLDNAVMIAIQANADGKRGSGARVTRRFPVWNEWSARFEVTLLDETLTTADLTAAVKWAGLVAGLGRFRPANGGFNGRFNVEKVEPFELASLLAA
jgi:hypothetical protein